MMLTATIMFVPHVDPHHSARSTVKRLLFSNSKWQGPRYGEIHYTNEIWRLVLEKVRGSQSMLPYMVGGSTRDAEKLRRKA